MAGCTPATVLNALASRDGLKISRSIAYASGPRHTLDVFRPANADHAPVVVFFYCGSWQWGSKETYAFVGTALAKRGYVVVIPDYRLYPDVRYPDFVEDGADAVAWARRHARDYGGDPRRLVLMGHSAGAYIAAMLAVDAEWLQKVGLDPHRDIAGWVGISGPYDFLPIVDPAIQIIFGGANRLATQPINYVKAGGPPALLLKARSDTIVDPGNSTRLAARLHAAGDSVREIAYPHVGHISIIGTFSPLLHVLAPTIDDASAFIDSLAATKTATSGQAAAAAQ